MCTANAGNPPSPRRHKNRQSSYVVVVDVAAEARVFVWEDRIPPPPLSLTLSHSLSLSRSSFFTQCRALPFSPSDQKCRRQGLGRGVAPINRMLPRLQSRFLGPLFCAFVVYGRGRTRRPVTSPRFIRRCTVAISESTDPIVVDVDPLPLFLAARRTQRNADRYIASLPARVVQELSFGRTSPCVTAFV